MAKFCKNCGTPLGEGAKFCPNCGTPMAVQPAQPAQPVQPTQPVQPAQPVQPTQPVQQDMGFQPAQDLDMVGETQVLSEDQLMQNAPMYAADAEKNVQQQASDAAQGVQSQASDMAQGVQNQASDLTQGVQQQYGQQAQPYGQQAQPYGQQAQQYGQQAQQYGQVPQRYAQPAQRKQYQAAQSSNTKKILLIVGIVVGALALIGLAIWGITSILGGGSNYKTPVKTFMDGLCDMDVDKMQEAFLPSQREDFADGDLGDLDELSSMMSLVDIKYTIGEAEKVDPDLLEDTSLASSDEIADATEAYNVSVNVEISAMGFSEDEDATACVMKYKGTWYLVGLDGMDF